MIIKQKNEENQENVWKVLEVCNVFSSIIIKIK